MRINPYKMFVGSFLPNWLLKCKDLTSNDKIIYARLCQYAGKDGECFPKQETIAEECGVTEVTVNASIKHLISFGLIEVYKRGQGHPNVYYFLDHEILGLKNFDFQNLKNLSSKTKEFQVHSIEENQLKESIKTPVASQTVESQIHNDAINWFTEHYQKTNELKYVWDGKSIKAIQLLLTKINKASARPDISAPELLGTFQYFITHITDKWVLSNFSLPVINSKFNEILNQIKNGQTSSHRQKRDRDAEESITDYLRELESEQG